MITEKDKVLLKQSIDLAINTVGQQVLQSQDEKQKLVLRGIVKEYVLLSDKVDKIKIEKPKK